MNGLREKVKAELRLIGLRDLAHALSLAQKIEDKNLILERTWDSRANRMQRSGPNYKINWCFSA